MKKWLLIRTEGWSDIRPYEFWGTEDEAIDLMIEKANNDMPYLVYTKEEDVEKLAEGKFRLIADIDYQIVWNVMDAAKLPRFE